MVFKSFLSFTLSFASLKLSVLKDVRYYVRVRMGEDVFKT